MIKNIGWTLGNDCPCRCKHCYSFSVRQKGQNLTKEIVDKVIEQIEKLNVETVNLGGNEPIFTNGLDVKNSMLPYILKELNKRNIKVGITTAGISLIALKNTYPECLELLNDVDISLDSPFENEHNENRGGDVYKYAIQALEICKEYNIESGIIMCAMNWNFTKDRIDALLEIAKKYDSNIRFNLLKPIQPQHFKLVPSKEQVLENYKYLFEKCDTVELSEPILSGLTQNNKVKGCACGIYSMRINSITPDGKIPVMLQTEMNEAFLNEEKNLKDMATYIKDTAKKQAKSGVAVIEDAVVFKWAKEYFMKSNKELGIKETRLDRGKHGDVSKVETKENEDNFGSIFDIDDNNENTSDNSKKEDIEQISLFAA